MKLTHFALVPLLLGTAAAQAGVITIGGSKAEACYHAAEADSSDPEDVRLCSDALAEEALNREDFAGTYVNRGIIHMNRGDHRLAAADFTTAREIDPGQAEAYLNAAILSMRLKDAATAIVMAARSIELDTDRPHIAYYVRGIAHEDQGAVADAYRDLKMAQSLKPDWDAATRELSRYQVVRR